jgi:predicted dithiol-disulfide oxidoreductase (DUF899 family)
MQQSRVVSREQWLEAHKAILDRHNQSTQLLERRYTLSGG